MCDTQVVLKILFIHKHSRPTKPGAWNGACPKEPKYIDVFAQSVKGFFWMLCRKVVTLRPLLAVLQYHETLFGMLHFGD